MTENPKGAQEGCSEARFDGKLPSWPRISLLRTDESPSAGRPRAEWLVGGGRHDSLNVAYAGAEMRGKVWKTGLPWGPATNTPSNATRCMCGFNLRSADTLCTTVTAPLRPRLAPSISMRRRYSPSGTRACPPSPSPTRAPRAPVAPEDRIDHDARDRTHEGAVARKARAQGMGTVKTNCRSPTAGTT
jgi:hypothetical protein